MTLSPAVTYLAVSVPTNIFCNVTLHRPTWYSSVESTPSHSVILQTVYYIAILKATGTYCL